MGWMDVCEKITELFIIHLTFLIGAYEKTRSWH